MWVFGVVFYVAVWFCTAYMLSLSDQLRRSRGDYDTGANVVLGMAWPVTIFLLCFLFNENTDTILSRDEHRRAERRERYDTFFLKPVTLPGKLVVITTKEKELIGSVEEVRMDVRLTKYDASLFDPLSDPKYQEAQELDVRVGGVIQTIAVEHGTTVQNIAFEK